MDVFKIKLQLFASPDTGGTGGTGTGNAGEGGSNAGEDKGGKVTFDAEQQAELDRIIAERVSRASTSASKKALEDQAKALGYESFDAMQAAAKAYKAAQEKQKSDLEKEQEAKAAAEAKAAQAEERAKQAYIKASFVAQAATANLVNVEDAFRLADLSSVTVKDDGTVEGVKEVVDALIKDKPYLVKAAGGYVPPSGGNPARPGGGSDDTTAQTKAKASKIAAQRLGINSSDADTTALAAAVASAVAQALAGQK
ncbi:MAG: hypothetical protein QM401_00745 [Bacillota bacterium]|nr:hypothetical protein [Bacillota bacterium]